MQYVECFSYQHNFFEQQREFNVAGYCISSLFLGQLHQYSSPPLQKVRVELHEILLDKNKLPYHDLAALTMAERQDLVRKGKYYHQNFIDRLFDTAVIHRRFDFDNYFKHNDLGKKRMLLDELHVGVLHVAQHFGWDTEPLQQAYQRCIDANLQNYFVAKRLGEKTSPNRQHKAHVWVEYDLTEIRLYLRVNDKTGNTIINQHFYTLNGLDETTMYPDDVMPILHGKLAWQGNEVVVSDKKGTEIVRTIVQSITAKA